MKDYLTFKIVDVILDEIKDDEELMKEFVFEFLTALAINNKAESFIKEFESWKKIYNTSFGKTSIELTQKIIKRNEEGDLNGES